MLSIRRCPSCLEAVPSRKQNRDLSFEREFFPNGISLPFRSSVSERSDLQNLWVCVKRCWRPFASVPGHGAPKELRLKNPCPHWCPVCHRPGQIVSLLSGNMGKTPKETGQKGGFIARNLFRAVHCGSPNMSDRSRGRIGAPSHWVRKQNDASWACRGHPSPICFVNSGPTEAGLKIDGGARGSGHNWDRAKCQRLTITALQSKLPSNFITRYKHLPLANRTHWWTWPIWTKRRLHQREADREPHFSDWGMGFCVLVGEGLTALRLKRKTTFWPLLSKSYDNVNYGLSSFQMSANEN